MNLFVIHPKLALWLVTVLTVMVSPAFAQIWDLTADFSTETNPNGPWTFGWSDKLRGTFEKYDMFWGAQYPVPGPVRVWCRVGPDFYGYVGINETFDGYWMGVESEGWVGWGNFWKPGDIMMMPPGTQGKDAKTVARWTAPLKCTIKVKARFTGQRQQQDDGSSADVHVLHNNKSIHDAFIDGFVGANPVEHYDETTGLYKKDVKGLNQWETVLNVRQGDMIDFVVGQGREFQYNGVGVVAHISVVKEKAPINEQETARGWVAAKFEGRIKSGTTEAQEADYAADGTQPPFSFVYNGKSSGEILDSWELKRTVKKLDNQRTQRILQYRDPESGLVARCVGIEYHDFPIVEWTLHFKNTGSQDTGIIEDAHTMDVTFKRQKGCEFILHREMAQRNIADELGPKQTARVIPYSIFSMSGTSPYTNLELPGEGAIVVIGWPGQTEMDFTRDSKRSLRVRGGQQRTHFKLHPGEEVRSALAVLQFWQGDKIDAHNVWRRWMYAHNIPRIDGELPGPQHSGSSAHQYSDMIYATEENQKMFIDRYLEEGLQLDYWWMDAGWYIPCETNWGITGTWEVHPKRFPNGLRAITDHARAKGGIKSILWFQPVRVHPEGKLWSQHPEFLIGREGDQCKMFDFGNPEALQWAIDRFSEIIADEGIDTHRLDENLALKAFWSVADTPDRKGVSEMKFVKGSLEYIDELSRRFPHLRHDHHRVDLETLRRATPLILTVAFEPISDQCHNYRLANWIPWHGIAVNKIDTYTFRSVMCSAIATTWDLRQKDLDYDLARKLIKQWREIAPNYYGDFYPLTPYSLASDLWMAWQYDRPEKGQGVVQVFRRKDSLRESGRFLLRGLDAKAKYTIVDIDMDKDKIRKPRQIPGSELMEQGLYVRVPLRNQAIVLTYEKSP